MSDLCNPKRIAVPHGSLARPGRSPLLGGAVAFFEDRHRTILSFSQHLNDPPNDFPPGDRPPGTRRSPGQAGANVEPKNPEMQKNRNTKMKPENQTANRLHQTHNHSVRLGGTNMHNLVTNNVFGRFSVSAIALFASLGFVAPAYATIDNTATAVGTYQAADDTTSAPDGENVPVAAKAPELTVSKSAGAPTVALGADNTIVDSGDTITFTYTVQNTGNVTLNNVIPIDTGPLFNGSAPVNALGGFTLTSATDDLAPGDTATYEAVYTLAQLDILRAAGITNGVTNSSQASGVDAQFVTYTETVNIGTAQTTIPANSALQIAKAYVLTKGGGNSDPDAEVGDTITYTYTVVNTGNVQLTNVAVNDDHEGATIALGVGGITADTLVSDGPLGGSVDGSNTDGVFDTMAAGATIEFTYVHTVNQTEFDNQ